MRRLIASCGAVALGVAIFAVPGAQSALGAGGGTRLVPSSGTTSIRSSALGVNGPQQPEIRPHSIEADGGTAPNGQGGTGASIFPPKPLQTPRVGSSALAAANPAVQASIQGLNHRDQRLANGGNQFSEEPPDQALCVGNGFTVESTNSVLRVYDRNAKPLTGVQDLNTFFRYPAAIDRATGTIGPNVIDPVCLYDPDVRRFVVAITTLFVDAAGDFNGKNTIDVAVSNTGDPTATWTIYHVPAQNDGADGTPNHRCTTDGTTPGPCFQDYPHLGADANGVYVTTNEYDLFGPNFNAAQIFSFSKRQLAQHPAAIPMTLVENLHLEGTPGFTVWPAQSPVGHTSKAANGTEFFLSSIAGDGSETGNQTGTANRIGVWALTNTRSLDSASPALAVSSRTTKSDTYVFPPKSNQKIGDIPLGECLNDTTTATPFGPGCWQLFFNPPKPAFTEVESTPDSNDTRMQQTWYVDGTLYGSLDTGIRVGKTVQAGVLWFAVLPAVSNTGQVSGDVVRQGYLALDGNNLTYPALTVRPGGSGIMAFTVMGRNHFPSAGYVTLDAHGTGPIHIVGEGAGPADGFTSYKAFVGDPPRTRWGDYGAAVTDGRTIWIASEYIAQTCTLTRYLTGAIGSCGGTRTSLGNWSTRITKIAE
jgi:hypothetical protein